MVDDVYVNNDMGYRNTDTRLVTLGFGASYEKTNDNTDRDLRVDRDTLEQNLKPADYEMLQDMFGTYWDMFIGGITATHRAYTRSEAKDFAEWADGVGNRIAREGDRLDAQAKRELQKRLCQLEAQMSTVGGTTRSCFMAKVKSDAIRETMENLTAAKLDNFVRGQELQAQTMAAANQAVYRAYIEGDNADYQKLVETVSLMKGSWTRQDAAERQREDIERDIETTRLTADFERSVGSTSETAGQYSDDYAAVLAAGQATNAAWPVSGTPADGGGTTGN